MTLHKIIEYIKYRWKAKGRHGTHSPFVYQFVESRLEQSRCQSLKQFLNSYFGDDLQIISAPVEQWEQRLSPVKDTTIIAIKDIHASLQHTNEWNCLKNEKKVKMSIDLFDYGLLLFRKDFLEKQHFIIKS